MASHPAPRQTGPAAAGVRPSRRRAALTIAAAALAGLAACSSPAPAASHTTTPPRASAASATAHSDVFTTQQQVSIQKVTADIDALYDRHPDIAAYDVQDVQYTTTSRHAVLGECTASSPGTQAAETAALTACAPMIFFLYSYGEQTSVPSSVAAAGELYWYAVTHITGPTDPRVSLDEVLGSWKLPVPALTAAQANAALVTSVLAAADNSMLARKSVHVEIAAGTERIVADAGTTNGTESITSTTATATIRVTNKAAYFSGNPAGLTDYLGLSAKTAAKVGSRWVAIKSGTAEYEDLAAENTMVTLPSSILPTSQDNPQLRTAARAGQNLYILSWKFTPSGSTTPITAHLTLTHASTVLPISETLATSDQTKTITFSRWDDDFTVTAPAPTIPYSAIQR